MGNPQEENISSLANSLTILCPLGLNFTPLLYNLWYCLFPRLGPLFIRCLLLTMKIIHFPTTPSAIKICPCHLNLGHMTN